MLDRPDNINIYIVYAEEDEPLKRELEDHLSTLQRFGHIDVWHEGLVRPGEDKEEVIAEHLRRAHIILLLISANFLSPDCYNRYESELRLAYERQSQGEVTIVPVILRHCVWQLDILAHLQPLPRGGHPVRSNHWESQDRAFQEIVLDLQSLAFDLKRMRATTIPPPPESARPVVDGTKPSTAGTSPMTPGDVQHLLDQLLEILSGAGLEEAIQKFSAVAHRSLLANGRLDPAFGKLNFGPARERVRLYEHPTRILGKQPTGRKHLGSRTERDVGEEIRFTIARREDLGGLGGQVRIFFPGDGSPPRISGLSL